MVFDASYTERDGVFLLTSSFANGVYGMWAVFKQLETRDVERCAVRCDGKHSLERVSYCWVTIRLLSRLEIRRSLVTTIPDPARALPF